MVTPDEYSLAFFMIWLSNIDVHIKQKEENINGD